MEYRKLAPREIEILGKHHCIATDWALVQVKDPFDPDHIDHVRFSGPVRIGKTGNPSDQNPAEPAGLYDSSISRCTIGDYVRISDVKMLHGYTVEDGAVVERVNEISMSGESAFGNGTEIEVLNEGGGRELKIYDELTSQVAYLSVLYRHDRELINALNNLIDSYTASKKSSAGLIGKNARIVNTGVIRDVWIGESAVVDGATLLCDGTLAGSSGDPVIIGGGVYARHFIIHHGSNVESSAILEKVFIGQGVRIGKQFSAENSVFFANCEGFHGEAVSLFAGPYSVTHHKSTLLIAALISFYNAGSGTNQSNHMYKLGPLHQGILERGSKTGSFAYLLWPCRVGAFSVVMGKHAGNFDTSDFPFSYVTVEDEKSFLTPGMNLITVGTRRDVEKWPARDRRKSTDRLDLITFDWLNPMVVRKALNASGILMELYEKTAKEQDSVSYKGVRIKRLLLKSCKKYYDMLVPIFLGEQVIKRLEGEKKLEPDKIQVSFDDPWVDVGGMITSAAAAGELTKKITSGKITSVRQLRENLSALNDHYDLLAWNWALQLMSRHIDKPGMTLGPEDFGKIIVEWKENKTKLNHMILADARKEFDVSSRTGFGIDGDETIRDGDFESVRGTYDTNKFVKGLLEENRHIEAIAAAMLSRLKK